MVASPAPFTSFPSHHPSLVSGYHPPPALVAVLRPVVFDDTEAVRFMAMLPAFSCRHPRLVKLLSGIALAVAAFVSLNAHAGYLCWMSPSAPPAIPWPVRSRAAAFAPTATVARASDTVA